MSVKTHSTAEGQRVNYLANLGGLVVIAGLETLSPSLLVGALSELNKRLAQLNSQQINQLTAKGEQLLSRRAAQKRSFMSWQRAQQSQRFDLTQTQMERLIVALDGKVPALKEDLANELNRLMRQW